MISVDYIEQEFGGSLLDELFGLVGDYDHTKYTFHATAKENFLMAKYDDRVFVTCMKCENDFVNDIIDHHVYGGWSEIL